MDEQNHRMSEELIFALNMHSLSTADWLSKEPWTLNTFECL